MVTFSPQLRAEQSPERKIQVVQNSFLVMPFLTPGFHTARLHRL